MAEVLNLSRIGVMSFAKFYAIFYAIFGLIVGILYFLMFLFFGMAMMGQESAGVGMGMAGMGIVFLIAAPIGGAIMGFIVGAVMAFIANIVLGYAPIEVEFKK